MDAGKRERGSDKAKQPYVKKPLNAFMIYMKEQRAAVVAECTLKESAAINQILGRKVSKLKWFLKQKSEFDSRLAFVVVFAQIVNSMALRY